MKTDQSHLPADKQQELAQISEIIKSVEEVGLIILFGSYARGDWVSDRYQEGHITYEYLSDYDILVIVKSEKISKNYGLWNDIEEKIKANPNIKTPVSLVIDSIHFVNSKLKEGNYFYSDIKNEGLVLYDSGEYKLPQPRALSSTEVAANAQRDFDFWYKKSQSFLKDFNHNIEDKELNNAAFHLHQVAEALYVAALLVYTGYKPKTHNIEKLRAYVIECDPDFSKVFANKATTEREIFEKLKSAYVDARYREDYKISLTELEELAVRVSELENLVKEKCNLRISNPNK